MKSRSEKNITVFNRDVTSNKGYLYTNNKLLSAKMATGKQTEELLKILKKNFPNKIRVLDIGCGDGKHTIELYKKFHPASIIGIDPAKEAIKIARERTKKEKGVSFKVGNIYEIDKIFRKNQFDLAVIRGVLHHLYTPQKAIRKIGNIFPAVIIIEANGYNPILKIIEKISPYHREHEEKSYWPPKLNSWFIKQGYQVILEKYFGIVPYFCPDSLARILKKVEPFLESIPLVNRTYTACNYILYRK